MTFVSHAQNFEDVLLWRALQDVDQGSYLDIGAQDPVLDSVSLAFYTAGWRGIHVEPIPQYAAKLRAARPDEKVIEAAVTDAEGPIEFFHVEAPGLSTGVAEIAEQHSKDGYSHRTLLVPCIRLDRLLEQSGGDFHWMKIDVEGMEADVLRSWGENAVRPWILIIEATFPNTQRLTHEEWLPEVLGRGYEEVFFDGLSRYFLHDLHRDRRAAFDAPANVFDAFAVAQHHFSAAPLRLKLEQRDESLATSHAELDSARRELDALRNELAASDTDREQVRAEYAKLQVEVERRGAELNETQVRLAREHAELDSARRELDALRNELAASDTDREQVRAEYAKLQLEVERRGAELNETRVRLENGHSQLESARGELETLRSQLAKTDADREQARRELAQSQIEIERRQGEMDRVLSELEDSRLRLATTRIELADAAQQHSAAIDQLWREREASEQSLRRDLRNLSEKLYQQVREAEVGEAAAQAKLGRVEERAKNLKRQWDRAHRDHERGRRETDEVLKELRRAIKESQAGESAAWIEIGKAQEQGKRLKAQLAAALEDRRASKSRISELESRGEKLEAELAAAKETALEVQTQGERLASERDDLINSRDAALQQTDRALRELRQARIEQAEAEAEIDRLNQQLDEQRERLHLIATWLYDKLGPNLTAISSAVNGSWWRRLTGSLRLRDLEVAQSQQLVGKLTRIASQPSHSADGEIMPMVEADDVEEKTSAPSAGRRALFTIVSNNYLHFARTLLASVRKFHPEVDVYCVIVDTDLSYAADLESEFTLIKLEQLDLPAGDRFLFQYNVLELNTAVKPWAFEYLMRVYDEVVYIDPDIRLYKRMNEVFELLAKGQEIILTPHLLAPVTDDKKPSELDIRRAGTYNFGFCALASTANSANFVRWWQSKLERECIIDMDRGIFVDQSWIDLVPGMFERVAILRHPGYNVAYWNIAQRKVEKAGRGRWTVNGEPLVFFHYSGLDPFDPGPFSKHQDRFTLSNLGAARGLVEAYLTELRRNGARTFSKIPYGFGEFEDGENVPSFFADLYRKHPELQNALGDKPLSRSEVLCEPGRTIDGESASWAMLALREKRVDIQEAFPLDTAQSIRAFRAWFANEAGVYFSPKTAAWHRDSYNEDIGAQPQSAAETEREQEQQRAPAPRASSGCAASENAQQVQAVTHLFYTLLGRFPEPRALETYSNMMSKPLGRLRVWKSISLSEENRRRAGWAARAARALLAQPTRTGFRTGELLGPGDVEFLDSEVRSTETLVATTVDQNSSERPWHEGRVTAVENSRLYKGIYFEHSKSDGAYWTAPDVSIPLPPDSGGAVLRVIANCSPPELEKQNGSPVNEIAVYVSKRFVTVSLTDAEGALRIEETIPEDIGLHPILHILSRNHFVPSAIGMNDDNRPLALRLQRIELDDKVIFDSTAEHPEEVFDGYTYDPPGFNLIGYVRAELGVGEAARGLAAAAKAAKIPYSTIDVGFQTFTRQSDVSALEAAIDERQPVDIVYVNADQTPNIMRHLAEIGHEPEYRIGFWHWEQPIFPKQWLGSFAELNEIWVPTAFVQDAVSAVSRIPVVKIPDAVHFKVPKRPSRKKFGLPNRKFAVLVMYDFHSYTYRKNPEAAIRAFRAAAADRKDATLVIKTINSDKYPTEFKKLKKAVQDLPDVVFVTELLTRQEVYELQSCTDLLMSLHRAEGFGLAPAEMMFLGKPVIATGWSGNMDFMTQMNSYPVEYELEPLAKARGVYAAGPIWANPDIDHAAWCLRRVMDNPEEAAKKAKRAAADVRLMLSPEAVGAQVRDRLNTIAAQHGIG